MKVALLSNVTVDVLAGMLKKQHAVWVQSGFGSWMTECIEPSVDLRSFEPDCVFVLLDGRTLREAHEDGALVRTALGNLTSVFPAAWVLVSNVDVPAVSCVPLTRIDECRACENAWQTLVESLVADHANACVFDLKSLVETQGRMSFYDARMRYAGSMPWSLSALKSITSEFGRYISAYQGRRKKVLALDLDNTLWKGVIGEDGVKGVRLAPDKDGKPYTDFQKRIKELLQQGVLLVCLSKNNVTDVEPIWDEARMMLKKEDFVSLKIDWNDKPINLRTVAKELNLGTDSFVFIDDNPAEREQMKAQCPEVVVPEFPRDSSALEAFIQNVAKECFLFVRTTSEDVGKTRQYQAETSRQQLAASAVSVSDYLKGLDISLDVHAVRDEEIARVAQLSQKTNQFNVMTNRYTEGDVRRFVSDPNFLIVSVHAGDRFGDQGLVAFVLAEIVEDATGKRNAVIHDWVMSCRTMNRRIEYAVQDRVEKCLAERGVSRLSASWRKTPKNVPVAELFDRFGFKPTEVGTEVKRYELTLPRIAALSYFVTFKEGV